MKKLLQFVVMFCFCCSVLSCQTKTKQEKLIETVKDLVEKAEKQHKELTVNEWKAQLVKFEEKFKELDIKSLKKDDFTYQQKLELAAYTARLAAISLDCGVSESDEDSLKKNAGDTLEDRIAAKSEEIDAIIKEETEALANDSI